MPQFRSLPDNDALCRSHPDIIIFVRRNSAIDSDKRLSRVERARRMTPEDRLLACLNISHAIADLRRSGKRHREAIQKPRS